MDEAAIKIVIVDEAARTAGSPTGPAQQKPTDETPRQRETARGGNFVGDAAAQAFGAYVGNKASGAGRGGNGPSGPRNKGGNESEPSREMVPAIGKASETGTALAPRFAPTGPTVERMIGHSEPWSGAVARSILERSSAASAVAAPTEGGFGLAGLATGARVAAGGLGVAAAGAVAVVASFKLLKNQVEASTAGYERLNGAIAANRAMIEVRGLLGDMRRANQIAGNLNRFDNTNARFDQAWKDIKTDLMDVALHYLNPGYEALADKMEEIRKWLHKISVYLIGKDNAAIAVQDDFVFQTEVERFFGLDRLPGFILRGPAQRAAVAQQNNAAGVVAPPVIAPQAGGFGGGFNRFKNIPGGF